MDIRPTSSLPTDVYGLITRFLDVDDIIVLRQTCKEFHELSKVRSVWDRLLRNDVLHQNIPIPRMRGKSLESMNSAELEQCYRRAFSLRRNWVSSSPQVHRQLTLVPNSRAIAIHVLPGHWNNWIVCLSLTAGQQRVFTLQCWDIGGSAPICLARRDFKQFRGMGVNRATCTRRAIAILNPEVEIISIDPQAANPDEGFVTEASVSQVQEAAGIHFFAGSYILTRNNNGSLDLWDINASHTAGKYQLHNPNLPQSTVVIDVLVTNELIVLLKSTTLEVYGRPSRPAPSSNNNTLVPISTFRLPWAIDNAVMTEVNRSSQNQRKSLIDILVRFRSYYPWALNILHHYVLHPNADFLADNDMSEHNPPYELAPLLRETIGSPVRLHTTSDMAIGPYGTAIWTDSHTEDYFNHADRGQRVAGIFSRYVVNEGEEIELSDQVATTVATSVYTYHEEDSWVRIALDEVEGRIFLGRDDGVISVLEYI